MGLFAHRITLEMFWDLGPNCLREGCQWKQSGLGALLDQDPQQHCECAEKMKVKAEGEEEEGGVSTCK